MNSNLTPVALPQAIALRPFGALMEFSNGFFENIAAVRLHRAANKGHEGSRLLLAETSATPV
jgi:hypothetical protein